MAISKYWLRYRSVVSTTGLVRWARGANLRTPRRATDGIISTAAEFRGAAAPRALDLLQKLEPDFQEGGAPLARSRRCFSGMFKPSSHGTPKKPMMVENWLPTADWT